MKKWLLGIFVVAFLYLPSAFSAEAAGGEIREVNDSTLGNYVCTPRQRIRHPNRCPSLGPAEDLAGYALLGLYPAKPLPGGLVDGSQSGLSRGFLKVRGDGIPAFDSAQAAFEGITPKGMVGPGFIYLSVKDTISGEGMTVYRTRQGFVRDEHVKLTYPARLQGLTFDETPERAVGWVTSGGSCTQRTPGGEEDYTGHCYVKHDVVQIFDTREVDGWVWYLVGIDEWFEQRQLAIVDPDPTPPEGVEGTGWISINLYEQTLAAYQDGELVFATVASTGRRNFWTRPGLFQVKWKLERDDMTSGEPGDKDSYYYLEEVPWVLYFDQARAMHGTYWHNRFGVQTSHGCVNLSAPDAHWVFEFAEKGTWVYVWDPSGQTPVDEAAYGAGGY